jgi:hypothetical protein
MGRDESQAASVLALVGMAVCGRRAMGSWLGAVRGGGVTGARAGCARVYAGVKRGGGQQQG